MLEFLNNDKTLTLVLGLIGGGITGLITHFFAPWFKWKLDEKTQTRKMENELKEYRRSLILKWRTMLLSAENIQRNGDGVANTIIQLNADYLSLEPLLTPDARKAVYQRNRTIVVGSELQGSSLILKDEIARLERQWELH
ncbi:hypothetical protein [Undibacterium flavidum]|uniref:YtxH-like protein n=1 Tax=Undibacterium flavidum TaxID=2762297 RepID=A0ABR6Y8M1_9BURK|nr:hypothetical protein [Undibacterium flavidum]MBC3872542.1 hypothetical protein [Undibacterium flavidum]